jgi:hypothetical protein
MRGFWLCLVFAAALAAGCQSARQEASAGVSEAVGGVSEGLDDAVLAPLEVLNLRRVPIPAKLSALRSEYEPLALKTCAGIAQEVAELTAVLGPDVDAPPSPREGVGKRLGDSAADSALGALESTVTDFIPYASILRAASGASKHEREVREAYARGAARRSYLKGVGAALGCPYPAAPDPSAGVEVTAPAASPSR